MVLSSAVGRGGMSPRPNVAHGRGLKPGEGTGDMLGDDISGLDIADVAMVAIVRSLEVTGVWAR